MLPVAGLGDDPASTVMTVTSRSNAISSALSSTTTPAEPLPSFRVDVVSRKNGSANGKFGYRDTSYMYSN